MAVLTKTAREIVVRQKNKGIFENGRFDRFLRFVLNIDKLLVLKYYESSTRITCAKKGEFI